MELATSSHPSWGDLVPREGGTLCCFVGRDAGYSASPTPYEQLLRWLFDDVHGCCISFFDVIEDDSVDTVVGVQVSVLVALAGIVVRKWGWRSQRGGE